MKKSIACSMMAAGMLLSVASHANSPVSVNSKEYKVLLDPSLFASNPSGAASSLLSALKTRLTQLNFDKTITGSFAAGDHDQISYYDSPSSCVLHSNGYSVRYRTGDDKDIEFKYGHPDEELSYYTDVTGTGKNKSSKIETDVSPDKLVYSHSTKQDAASSGAPTTVSALISQFSGASTLSSYSSQSLVPVNGLTMNQQEYDGPSSDIGNSDADFTLTIWYVGNASAPSLVELSFRVDADSSSYFTTPVLQRSQLLMQAISSLGSWNLANSTTKTAWVYAYHSAGYPNGFCAQ
ncbi:hypothetical protein [Dyella sp.]|uniref:hypothetical protein n=1 Tax=Dyella sp. TaxID=1869338 RepID=UPI002ED4BFFA